MQHRNKFNIITIFDQMEIKKKKRKISWNWYATNDENFK